MLPLVAGQLLREAVVRLFESHGRVYGGPVEALRDELLEAKEHDAALDVAMRAGLKAVLDQLSPTNAADQFEQGRTRALAPGQNPRPKYWEHCSELYSVIMQNDVGGVPHPFVEAFVRAYDDARAESSARRRGRGET